MSELRERLAAQMHRQWQHWTKHMLGVIGSRIEVHVECRGDSRCDECQALARWYRQLETPYADLSEEEKQSDRRWADEALLVSTAHLKDWSAKITGLLTSHDLLLDRTLYGSSFEKEDGTRVPPQRVLLKEDGTYEVLAEAQQLWPMRERIDFHKQYMQQPVEPPPTCPYCGEGHLVARSRHRENDYRCTNDSCEGPPRGRFGSDRMSWKIPNSSNPPRSEDGS